MSLTVILKSDLDLVFDRKAMTNRTERIMSMIPKDKKYYEWQSSKDYSSDLHLESTNNGLVNSFLLAYNNHLPIKLTPDIIHVAICQVIANFMQTNSEHLRNRFVKHSGTQHLNVVADTISFGIFSQLMVEVLEENVKDPKFLDLLTAKYSTSTFTSYSVSCMTIMNTLKEYFTYEFTTMCGIPSVILEGTQDDWNLLKKKYSSLRNIFMGVGNKELDGWFPYMDNIIDLFVDMRSLAISGTVNATEYQKEIFSRIITTKEPYGSGTILEISGWINILTPYTNKNKLIDFGEKTEFYYGSRGYTSFQTSFTETPVKYTWESKSWKTIIKSGFSCYSHVDPITNVVTPVLEYKVMAEIADPIG